MKTTQLHTSAMIPLKPLIQRPFLAGLVIVAAMLSSAAQAGTPREVAKHGVWHVFDHPTDRPRSCFMASKPTTVDAGRSDAMRAVFWISMWPKAGVRSQPSVRGSQPFREGSDVTISIGGRRFALFTSDDKAFVEDPTAELKLIDAMKRGNVMLVEGLATSGLPIRDRYSLAGVTKALSTLTELCQ